MPATDRPSVLLVDDNDQTCTLVLAVLQNEFHVQTASNGVEALTLLQTRDYQAILLDLKMPGLDGYDVLEQLRSSRPEILGRILIFTAALSRSEMERVRKFSVRGIVGKPFDVETFRRVVRQCACAESEDPWSGLISSCAVVALIAPFLH